VPLCKLKEVKFRINQTQLKVNSSLSALPQQSLQTGCELAHNLSMGKKPLFDLQHAATQGALASAEPAITAATTRDVAYRNALLEAVSEGANALLRVRTH